VAVVITATATLRGEQRIGVVAVEDAGAQVSGERGAGDGQRMSHG
jgi:hypothetical protein